MFMNNENFKFLNFFPWILFYFTDILNKYKPVTDLNSDLSFILIDLFDQKVKSVTWNRADKDLVQSNCLKYFKISIEQQ